MTTPGSFITPSIKAEIDRAVGIARAALPTIHVYPAITVGGVTYPSALQHSAVDIALDNFDWALVPLDRSEAFCTAIAEAIRIALVGDIARALAA